MNENNGTWWRRFNMRVERHVDSRMLSARNRNGTAYVVLKYAALVYCIGVVSVLLVYWALVGSGVMRVSLLF